ncbi:MAG: NAD(P)/FAD-dependent oxidoreductase [bacterium]|nr:NAD(P)/FAD-dependent oxidoreductase [bacterium]
MLKILILGGGFGGIRCALDLDKKLKNEAEITLIDRNGYHLFVPAIYEVASAYGIKKDPFAIQLKKTICIPYADIFEDTSVNFIQAEISNVDLANKRVRTNGDHALEYDYLVLALGSDTSTYDIPGVQEYAHQFKTLEDALFINQKLEELSQQFIKGHRTEPFSFLICGGGFTGLEVAAELGCCSRVIKSKCKLKGRCSTITLFEAGSKILPILSEKERKSVKQRLTQLGIVIMESSPIEEIGPDYLKLKNGQKLNGDLIIWTAGIMPNQFLKSIANLILASSGKIPVEENLKVKGLENIFAVGDNIEFIDKKNQKPIPALAYLAIDQGKIVAKNIYSSIKNKELKSYKPSYNFFIIPVGGKYALANLGGVAIKGFMAWVFRLLVDLRYFLSILSPYKAFKLYVDEMTVFLKND